MFINVYHTCNTCEYPEMNNSKMWLRTLAYTEQ